jgi:SCF-associated factor 1
MGVSELCLTALTSFSIHAHPLFSETNDGRLGLVKFPKSHIHGVPFPTQLRIPGVRIVSMVAGGMSFHALDTEGNIYVWGGKSGFSSPIGV